MMMRPSSAGRQTRLSDYAKKRTHAETFKTGVGTSDIDILQMKMGDQDVFTTPQQNILVAKALIDTIEPLLGDDHAATPIAA